MGFFSVKIVNYYCLCTWQLRLLAEDGGSPRKTATTTVDITVTRNLLPPVFNPSTYIQSIIENYPVGSEIVTVSATDSDPQVCLKMMKLKKKKRFYSCWFSGKNEYGQLHVSIQKWWSWTDILFIAFLKICFILCWSLDHQL